MIYLDANIFIYSLINDDKLGDKSRKILTKIPKRETNGFTSILTWDEVVYVLRKIIGIDKSIDEGNKLLNFPNLIFLDSNKKTIEKAQKIMEKYKIKPRDDIHIATALTNNIDKILSDDKDFDGIREIQREGL